MKHRIITGALIVIALIIIILMIKGLFVINKIRATIATKATPAVATTTVATPASSMTIAKENALPGTTDWIIPDGHVATTQIQAYASTASVLPGHTLTFYVSTLIDGTAYSINFYRLGWYGGKGARLMGVQNNLVGHAQGIYNIATHQLEGCTSCLIDSKTGLIDASWQPSYAFTIPADWITGVYLAKFTDSMGLETYVIFDVRSNVASPYIAVTPDVTFAAYNEWGGRSLYYGYNSQGMCSSCRAVKVSLDRPSTVGNGSGQLYMEIDAIRWLERQGYDLSYMSNIDLQQNPSLLLQHRAYIDLGHDEYWTKEMRDAVEHARNIGIGLAFFSGNDMFWQVRLEPNSEGVPDRTVVCYRVSTASHTLALDPFYGKDNSRLTAQWRDPILARPENSVIGIMYSNLVDWQGGFSWQLNPQATSPLLDGTGLQAGQPYGCRIVGNEWDRIFDNGATPEDLHVLGLSPTVDSSNHPDVSNTTYYIASSGAMIFATGSIYWTSALDSYRYYPNPACSGQDLVVPGLQKLLVNVMAALVVKHPVE